MIRSKRIIFIGVLGLILSACVKDIAVPAYVTVNEFTLKTDLATEGSTSHDISDVWFFLDDKLQGVYELPATFPVIADGSHTVRLRPGIKVSGLDSWRSIYPFYDFVTQDANFSPNADLVFNPEVEYFSATKFKWLESFENPGISFKKGPNSDTTFVRVNDNALVFEGTGSGAFFIDTARRRFEGITTSTFNLPIGGRSVFLEMDYRCNNTFVVGVIGWMSDGTSETAVSFGLYPNEEWNKTYINMAIEVSSMPNAVSYTVFIQSVLDNDNDEGWAYFDNFKLVSE